MKIKDFDDSELWTISSALHERYGREVELQMADTELRLRSMDRELTVCPSVYWEEDGCSFIISKTGRRLTNDPPSLQIFENRLNS